MAEWSNLSFSSLDLLAHTEGYRFESCQRLFVLYLYSYYSIQIRNYPTPHMYAQLPQFGKKCCTT